MGIQAYWNGLAFGVSGKTLRPIQSLRTNRTLSYETYDYGSFSATDAVINLAQLDIHVDFVRSALNSDPRKAWADLFWAIGEHATFYLAGRLLMVNELILMSVDQETDLLDPDGEMLKNGVDCHFQEWVYNKHTLSLVDHSPYINYANHYWEDFGHTDPYNEAAAAAALGLTLEEARKRIPSNPQINYGHSYEYRDRGQLRFGDLNPYSQAFRGY